MPRTLPAALTTAMDAGIFSPYLRVTYMGALGLTQYTVQPLRYKLPSLANEQATVTFRPETGSTAGDMGSFRITRGAMINGTPSTITTIHFQTIKIRYDGKFVTLTGEVLPQIKTALSANISYQDVIEGIFDPLVIGDGITASYEGTAAWKAYQFYPDGRSVVLSPLKNTFTILKQKYLIFAVENGYDPTQITCGDVLFFVATDTRTLDYNITDVLFSRNQQTEARQLLWRDEASVVHTSGLSQYKIHNLGYLESTASAPTNASCADYGSKSTKLPVHLKYQTGDYVHITGDGTTLNEFTGRIKVTEVFDSETEPAWYMEVEKLDWFGSTEGGNMPGTLEAAAPYTPLVTGHFNGILSANDNNLQAAMETIDDHDHSGLATTEGIQDIVGAMFTGNTETGGNLVYQDSDGTIDLEVTDATISTSDITTNDASTSKHGWLKKLSNVASEFMDGVGNWTRNITARELLFTHGKNVGIAASTTNYLSLVFRDVGFAAAADNIVVTEACTIDALYVTTNSAQPASGSLVFTIMKNNVASALTITVAAGTAANTFSNTANVISLAAGDAIGLQIVNNATATSALITRIASRLLF